MRSFPFIFISSRRSNPHFPHSHCYSLHSHPDSRHSHLYSLHSHLYSLHSHPDFPHSHHSPHSISRFPIPGFTDSLGYLNINHLPSKIDHLRKMCSKAPNNILYPPYRKDRNKNGGGKMVFIREGLVTKWLKAFEGDISETICLERTISRKVWFITYVYRLPYNNNKDNLFNELSNTLSFATSKYENILIIGDLRTDTSTKKKENGNYLSDLFDTFSLKNLIIDITCVKFTNGTSIVVLLTNKLRCFHHTVTFETGFK